MRMYFTPAIAMSPEILKTAGDRFRIEGEKYNWHETDYATITDFIETASKLSGYDFTKAWSDFMLGNADRYYFNILADYIEETVFDITDKENENRNEYNRSPKYPRILETYEDKTLFWNVCKKDGCELRQAFWKETDQYSMYTMTIWWVDKDKNLGYGLIDSPYRRTVELVRFGSNFDWRELNREQCAAFTNDMS